MDVQFHSGTKLSIEEKFSQSLKSISIRRKRHRKRIIAIGLVLIGLILAVEAVFIVLPQDEILADIFLFSIKSVVVFLSSIVLLYTMCKIATLFNRSEGNMVSYKVMTLHLILVASEFLVVTIQVVYLLLQ